MIAQRPLPFPRLEFIDDPLPRAAALNMAVDEILLERLGALPLLRVYRWERSAVSFGCFELFEALADRWPGRDLVRRWTGGGIVPHGEDLTFSLFVPRPLMLAMMPAAESYRLIHSSVASAMESAGCYRATMQSAVLPDAANASRVCFKNPVRYDLLLTGRKVAGGAQRRTRRGLLHQGSIQDTDTEGQTSLTAGMIRALTAALPHAFGETVEARSMNSEEIEAATTLAAEKYGSIIWLRRR